MTVGGTDRSRPLQPVMLLWLTMVWVALWQDLSPANVLAGAAVAVAVSLVFPMPRVRLGTRLHPGYLLALLLRFLVDIVTASFQVAWLTLQLGRRPRGAVFAVDLASSSDFVMTTVAHMTTLVPGSLAVEARRHTHRLFVHVLDLGDHDVDHFRTRVLAQEQRLLRAIGEAPGEDSGRHRGNEPHAGSPGGRP